MFMHTVTFEQHRFDLHGPTYFSIVSTIVLHDIQLVESTDAEPLIWRADYKVMLKFSTICGSVSLTPRLFKGQLYLMPLNCTL